MKIKGLFLVFLLTVQTALALPQDLYPFKEQKQQQQFYHLLAEFRCLVCQNENLADSQATLASDLRQQIYQQVLANESDQEITAYLVNRYGDFVLYRPPLQRNTVILWIFPLVLLIIAFVVLYFILKRQKKA